MMAAATGGVAALHLLLERARQREDEARFLIYLGAQVWSAAGPEERATLLRTYEREMRAAMDNEAVRIRR